MPASGEDLIRKIAAGDQEAFARFYDRYASLVYGLVLRIVRERSAADDVLQRVFYEAWESAGSYAPERGTPEAWILIRTRSRAIDWVRARRRSSVELSTARDELTTAARVAPDPDPSERAAARALLAGALDGLPESQQEIIELAYWEGLTQAEIADRLSQPLGTVKTRMRDGLEQLRKIVGKRR